MDQIQVPAPTHSFSYNYKYSFISKSCKLFHLQDLKVLLCVRAMIQNFPVLEGKRKRLLNIKNGQEAANLIKR